MSVDISHSIESRALYSGLREVLYASDGVGCCSDQRDGNPASYCGSSFASLNIMSLRRFWNTGGLGCDIIQVPCSTWEQIILTYAAIRYSRDGGMMNTHRSLSRRDGRQCQSIVNKLRATALWMWAAWSSRKSCVKQLQPNLSPLLEQVRGWCPHCHVWQDTRPDGFVTL